MVFLNVCNQRLTEHQYSISLFFFFSCTLTGISNKFMENGLKASLFWCKNLKFMHMRCAFLKLIKMLFMIEH